MLLYPSIACSAFGKFAPSALEPLHIEIVARLSQQPSSESLHPTGANPTGFAIHDGDHPDMLDEDTNRVGGLVRANVVSPTRLCPSHP